MQDWPLEISHEIAIADCLREYPLLSDEDEKFLLMHAILYALDDITDEALFAIYAREVEYLLREEFSLHRNTIYYWTCYAMGEDETNEEDGFQITPLMRTIWNDQTT